MQVHGHLSEDISTYIKACAPTKNRRHQHIELKALKQRRRESPASDPGHIATCAPCINSHFPERGLPRNIIRFLEKSKSFRTRWGVHATGGVTETSQDGGVGGSRRVSVITFSVSCSSPLFATVIIGFVTLILSARHRTLSPRVHFHTNQYQPDEICCVVSHGNLRLQKGCTQVCWDHTEIVFSSVLSKPVTGTALSQRKNEKHRN